MKTKHKYMGVGCLGGGLLVALALSAILGYLFWQYQRIPTGQTQNQFPISVVILDPGSGHEVTAGIPVMVSIQAWSSEPLLSVELWANNMLIGVQGAPSMEGVPSLPANLLWLPAEAGLYNLQARAVSAQGQTTVSDATWVFIRAVQENGEGEGEEDVYVPAPSGGGMGEPPADIATAGLPAPPVYSPSAPPPAADPPQPAEIWTPDLSSFLTWLSPPAFAPKVPELNAGVEGCKVSLTIHDLSEDELGFKVYRTKFGETQNADPTYTLAPQPGQGWLLFEDNLPHGSTYVYVVEAFSAAGASGPSNPVTVDALASGCPPPDAPPMNSLKLIGLQTAFPAAKAYCYISLNGLHWFRFPPTGFFPQGQDGSFELQGQVSDLFLEVDSEGDGSSVTPTSYWDCWGWSGSELSQLGIFQVDLGLTPDGPKTIKDDANLAELVYTYGDVMPKGDEISLEGFLESDFTSTIEFNPKAFDPQLIAPTLHYTTSPADCIANLPEGADSDDCHTHPYHQYYEGLMEQHVHPYLYWDLNNKDNCADPGNCTDVDEISYFPNSVSDWGYNLYDLQISDSTPIKTYHGFEDHLYRVSIYGSCGQQRTFEVRTFIELDQTFTYESSSPYAIQTFAQPCSINDETQIDVEFTSLTFDNVDDGWFDDDIEVYGDFHVGSGYGFDSDSALGNMGGWGTAAGVDGCILEGLAFYGDYSKAGWGCPQTYENETVTAFGMCMTGYSPDLCATYYSPIYNPFHIKIRESDNHIPVSIALFDYDHQSGNDPVCVGTVWMTKEPTQTWMQAINYQKWYLVQGDNGNASCTVTWTTTVHEP